MFTCQAEHLYKQNKVTHFYFPSQVKANARFTDLPRMGKEVSGFLSSSIFTLGLRNKRNHTAMSRAEVQLQRLEFNSSEPMFLEHWWTLVWLWKQTYRIPERTLQIQ